MPVPADRWLEMDLTWVDPSQALQPQIDALFDRIAPLLASVEGERGIFFNVGWLIDLVTEWTGDPGQHIPTRSRRTAGWAAQTYADLKHFVGLLRARASLNGLPDLKIGVLLVGWGHVVWPPELKIYDFDSDWYDRHPELYGPPLNFIGMPVLMPNQRLREDDYPYATAPGGLEDGATFPELFGAQWGAVSRYLGLDAIHLRDGLAGPMVYTRNGPFGTTASEDPAAVDTFSQAVRDLFQQVKLGNPEALVFGYSSAISPVADWRVGCVDFEALVADGYIDAWVEQTWGGAWQDWWHQLWKGWTFQLANLLTRGAMIAAANEKRPIPCRFYNLIETWDGWEPWDTIHQVPHKLRWAMWAFSHAAVLTPAGPKVPNGSYISWMNNGRMELLGEEDIHFLLAHLDTAQQSAAQLETVFGPVVAYNRPLMAWLSENHPAWNVSEWVDDQAAMLMKWGISVLGATRTEWLASVESETVIAQTPGHLGQEALAALLDSSGPVLVTGRADALDQPIRDRLGITPHGDLLESGFYVSADHTLSPPYDRPFIPSHQPVEAEPGTTIHYQSEKTPLITSRDNWMYWQPPDWSEPFNAFVPKYQLGSTFPHFRVSALLQEAARSSGLSYIEGVTWATPIAFSLWHSAGQVYALFGNLETGVFGDSRTSRSVVCHLSRAQLALDGADYELRLVDASPGEGSTTALPTHDPGWLSFQIELPPEQCMVCLVSPVEPTEGRSLTSST